MNLLLFCAFSVRIFRTEGQEVRFSADLYNRWRRFSYACHWVGRASALRYFYIYLALPPFEFPGTGAGDGTFAESLQLALLVSITTRWEGEHAEVCFTALPPFEFFGVENGI